MGIKKLTFDDDQGRAHYVREAQREMLVSELQHDHLGLMRGLIIALALSAPFWLVIYLLLR